MGELELYRLQDVDEPGDGDGDDGGGSYAEYILTVVDNGYMLETPFSKYVFTSKGKLLKFLGDKL